MYLVRLEFGHLAIEGEHKSMKKPCPLTQNGYVGLAPVHKKW